MDLKERAKEYAISRGWSRAILEHPESNHAEILTDFAELVSNERSKAAEARIFELEEQLRLAKDFLRDYADYDDRAAEALASINGGITLLESGEKEEK